MFSIDLGHGLKPWLVVSNNVRNRNLDTMLAARITTTDKNARIPTVVALGHDDPLVGYVLCDDLVQLYGDELTRPLGALAVRTMRAVSDGLKVALALT